jgi:hypothetical protein
LEEVLPVEHDWFVNGVRHEPLRGLRDVLPQFVVRTVLLLQQAFVNTIRKEFALKQNPTVEYLIKEKCVPNPTYTE